MCELALTPNYGGTNGEEVHASGPGALTHEGDVLRIPAEQGDMLLDPVQGGNLIHEPVIRDSCFGLRRHVGVQETEHAQPVVHGDDHLVGVAGQDAAVVGVSAAPVVALAVNVQQHRMLPAALRHACDTKASRRDASFQFLFCQRRAEATKTAAAAATRTSPLLLSAPSSLSQDTRHRLPAEAACVRTRLGIVPCSGRNEGPRGGVMRSSS